MRRELQLPSNRPLGAHNLSAGPGLLITAKESRELHVPRYPKAELCTVAFQEGVARSHRRERSESLKMSRMHRAWACMERLPKREPMLQC